jgi:hypothetical protein
MPRGTSHLSNTELAEALDRIMNKGAVLQGDLVIAVADVDLLYLDVRLVLSAVDTALGPDPAGPSRSTPDPLPPDDA